MGKYKAVLFKRLFFKAALLSLLWSSHRIYIPALQIFKIYDPTSVDSSDDEDEMDY